MGKGKVLHKGLATVLLASSLILVAGCSSEDKEDTGTSDVVVVNNGEDVESGTEEKETKEEPKEDGETSESEVVVPEREIVQDKVPKTTRETLTWGDELNGEPKGSSQTETSGEAPDLSKDYIEVNGGSADKTDFSIGYSLYFADGNKRPVGGEGVSSQDTLAEKPETVDGGTGELYSMQLLDTGLLADERGLEDRNQVQVTKQAYNLIAELSQNIYDVVGETQQDNHVYLSVEALYQGEETIPYGVHYQAKSVHGDVNFNYIIHNIQEGNTVNYMEGTVGTGDANG